MSDIATGRAPAWLKIVAALALLWNLLGVYAYLVQVGTLAPPDPTMVPHPMPGWATGAFAISVFGGVVGCIGLFMLKSWSRLLLLLSLLALLVQDAWVFAMGNGMEGGNPILPILVNLIAILLVWLAHMAGKKGWLS